MPATHAAPGARAIAVGDPSRSRPVIEQRLAPAAAIAAQFVYGAVIASAWPDRSRVGLLLAIHVARFVSFGVIIYLGRRVAPSPRSERIGPLAMGALTIVCGLAMAHVASWTIAAHLSIPFGVVALTNNLDRDGKRAGALYVVLAAAVAVIDGVSLSAVAGLVAGCLAVQALMETRAQVLTELINLAEQQRDQLHDAKERMAHMHTRAVEHEKLSSLGLLAAGVAHEINNPMSYVTANLGELVQELKTHQEALPATFSAAADELLRETVDGVSRVNTIVGDLRRYARDGREEEEQRFELHEQVRASARICASAFRDGVTLTLELAANEAPILTGHPNQIVQLLINLLVNGAQAIKDDGRVRLSTRVDSREVVITVEDDGVGMTEATVKRIFDPFFTTKATGTGLGLAVVQGIVRSHGGRIEVDSAVGRGTTINVILPRAPGGLPA